MADAGQATFRAIADFSRLRRESRKTSDELDRMTRSARSTDKALADAEDRSEAAGAAMRKSQAEARRNSDLVAAARRREADAAGRVRVAEEALAKVRNAATVDRTKLVAAEERLAKSQRDLVAAQTSLTRHTDELRASQVRVTQTTRDYEKAQTRLQTSTARTAGVMGRLRAAFRAAGDEQSRFGRTVTNIGKRLPGVIALLTKFVAVLGLAALASGALHASAAGVMSLVGALGALSGVVGILPAALGLLAGGLATVIIGFKGFGDAMSAIAEGDAAKFEEALQNLTPAAQGVARALWDMRPAFQSIKDTVQERLFAGMADEVRTLGRTYLPMLESTLGRVASALNNTVRGVMDFYQTSRAVEGTRRIFDRISDAFERMAPAGRNVAEALFDITDVGSEFLAPMADGITDATRRFKDFIAQAKQTGQLREWIGTGIEATRRLGSTIGNLGSTIMGVFRAANSVGRDFLQTLDEGTERMARWVNSLHGQNTLANFFQSASRAAAVLWPIVGALATVIGNDLAPLLARIAEKIGPGVTAVIYGLGDAFNEAGPGLERLFGALGDLLEALGEAGPLVGALAGGLADVLAPAVKALATGLEALTTWFNSLPEPMQSVIGKIGGVVIAAGGLLFVLGKLIKVGQSVAATFAALKVGLGAIGLIKVPKIDAADAAKKGKVAGAAARGGFLGALGRGLTTAAGAIFGSSFFASAGAMLKRVGPKLLGLTRFLGPWGFAISTAITAAWGLFDNWDSVVSGVKTAASGVGDFFSGWGPAIGGAISSAGDWFNTLPEKASAAFTNLTTGVSTWGSGLVSTIGTALGTAASAVGTWFMNLPTTIGNILGQIPQIASDLLMNGLNLAGEVIGFGVGTLINIFIGIPGAIGAGLVGLGMLLYNIFSQAFTWAYNACLEWWPQIQAWFVALPGRIGGALASLGGWVANTFTHAWSQAQRITADWTGRLVGFVAGLPQRIINGVASLGGRLFTWSSDAWQGARNAAQGKIDAFVGWVQGLPGRISGAVSSLPGRLSSWASDAWRRASDGFARGIDNVVGWARGLPGRISSAIGNLGSTLWNAGKSMIDGFFRGLRNAAGPMLSWVSGLASRIANLKGPIEYDRVLLTPHGREIINGLLKGLRAQWPYVQSQLESWTRSIPDMTVDVRTAGMSALRNAGLGTIAPRLAGPQVAAPQVTSTLGGAEMTVSVTQNIYNPTPETPSESLTRRMRRASELGLREVLDRRAG